MEHPSISPASAKAQAATIAVDEPCPDGAVLSFGIGVLLLWTASDQALTYLSGNHQAVQMSAKLVLAVFMCLAIPVVAFAYIMQRLFLRSARGHDRGC